MTATRKLGIRAPDTESSPASPSEPSFSVRSDVGSPRNPLTESTPERSPSDPDATPSTTLSHVNDPSLRPPLSSPEYAEYLKGIISTSKTVHEAARRLGNKHPNTVRYQMKKWGLPCPPAWSRPEAPSPEFVSKFELALNTSSGPREAAQKMGFRHYTRIYDLAKRLEIKTPAAWSLWRTELGLRRQLSTPEIIIHGEGNRTWVAALVQGEGSFSASYVPITDMMRFNIVVGMTDPDPIFKLSDCYGLPYPTKPIMNRNWKPMWRKTIGGVRAMRVLEEIRPFLVGGKLKEAERALEFFSPMGYHSGKFGLTEIWPRNEFPLRCRRNLP